MMLSSPLNWHRARDKPNPDIMLCDVAVNAIVQETAVNKQMFDKALSIRRDMFGADLADKTWAAADDFNRPSRSW